MNEITYFLQLTLFTLLWKIVSLPHELDYSNINEKPYNSPNCKTNCSFRFRHNPSTKAEKELPRPYLAFHAEFDQEVLSDFLGRPIAFDGDLHVLPHSKDRTHRKLGGPIIQDPLKGKSKQVPILWEKYLRRNRQFLLDGIIQHNRACLLKETHISQQACWKPISNYVLTYERMITIKPKNKTTRTLLHAIKQQRLVNIIYRNQKGDETIRKIAIFSLGHQYFSGFCYLRNEIRTFKTSRLSHLSLTLTRIKNTQLFW